MSPRLRQPLSRIQCQDAGIRETFEQAFTSLHVLIFSKAREEFATPSVATSPALRWFNPEHFVIREVTQMPEHNTATACGMYVRSLWKATLVGDQEQLSPPAIEGSFNEFSEQDGQHL